MDIKLGRPRAEMIVIIKKLVEDKTLEEYEYIHIDPIEKVEIIPILHLKRGTYLLLLLP